MAYVLELWNSPRLCWLLGDERSRRVGHVEGLVSTTANALGSPPAVKRGCNPVFTHGSHSHRTTLPVPPPSTFLNEGVPVNGVLAEVPCLAESAMHYLMWWKQRRPACSYRRRMALQVKPDSDFFSSAVVHGSL